MTDYTNAIVAVIVAIIGLATLAVILSKQANTASVIQASSQGLGTLINAAVSPVTGGYTGLSTYQSSLIH